MDSIAWYGQSYSIKDFVTKYPPPQIVRVDDGFYGSVDEGTLSQGQVITLHTVKRADKVRISVATKEGHEKTVFIPLNCPERVEILPKGCRDKYSNMGDLLRDSPAFVRAIHNTPWLNLNPGDILKRQDIVRDGRTTYVVFEFCDKTRGLVRIPVNYDIAFEALAVANSFFLKEVVELFTLPVRLRFTEHGAGVEGLSGATGLKTLDDVLLEQLCEEETIIATSRHENVAIVLNIPVDLDVTVTPALGSVLGNKEYTRLCRFLHNGAKLEKVVHWNRVRDDTLTVEKVHEYEEVSPLCPPRRPPKPPSTPLTESSSSAVEKGEKNSRDDHNEGDDSHLKVSLVSLGPAGFIRPCHTNRESAEGQEYVYGDVKEEEVQRRRLVSELIRALPPVAPSRTTSLRELVADERSLSGSRSDCLEEKASIYYHRQDSALQQPYDDVAVPKLVRTALEWPHCSENDVEECYEYFNIDEEVLGSKERLLCSPGAKRKQFTSSAGAVADTDTVSNYPQEVRELSVQELGEWLQKLNMKQYVHKFAQGNIDGATLCRLNRADMKKLGVNNEFHQTILARFTRGWKPNLE